MATVRPIDLISMGLQDAPASLQVRQEKKITK